MSQSPADPPMLSSQSPRWHDPASLRRFWETSGLLLAYIILFTVASLTIDNFASVRNILNILLSITTIAFVSCTMMFCLAAGDFDLSVGSTAALAGMIALLVMNAFQQSPITAMLLGITLGLLAGAVVGLINGVLIAKAKINALIATLATMQIIRARAYLSNPRGSLANTIGSSLGSPIDQFNALGTLSFPKIGGFQGVPLPVWLMLIFFIVFGVLLHRTTFGRNTLAIGGNKEAARFAGIAVDRTKIIIFVLQGLAAAFAGIILAARSTSGAPGVGIGLELQAISACVLGGVSLTGGVASMTGVIVGLLIMGTAQNALNLMNVNPYSQSEINGYVLLAAVLLDIYKQKLRK